MMTEEDSHKVLSDVHIKQLAKQLDRHLKEKSSKSFFQIDVSNKVLLASATFVFLIGLTLLVLAGA